MSKHCAYVSNGKHCRGYAIQNSEFCYTHDPAKAKERKEARSRGGFARHGRQIGVTGETDIPGDGTRVEDVRLVLWRELVGVLSLEKSQSRARTVGSLAGVLFKAFEVGQLEARLTAIENKLSGKEDTKNVEQD